MFNRHTAGEAIRYFSDANALTTQLEDFDWKKSFDRQIVRNRYTANRIAGAYANLIRGSFNPLVDEFVEKEGRSGLIEDAQTGLD